MFGSVRRVISGDDVCDNPQQQQQQQQQPGLTNNEQTANNSTAQQQHQSNSPPPAPSTTPAATMMMIVEPDTTEYSGNSDDRDPNAPLDLIAPPNRNASDTFTTSSSLSDASQEDGNNKDGTGIMMHHQVDVYMEDVLGHEGSPTPLAGVASGNVLNQHPPAHYQLQQSRTTAPNNNMSNNNNQISMTATTTTNTTMNNTNNTSGGLQQRLQRMDSSDGSDSGSARAAASQNSSRDWGWFEDVHQSGQLTPTGSLTKGHHGGHRGSGGGGISGSGGNGGGNNRNGGGGGNNRNRSSHQQMMKPMVPRMVVGLDPKDETAAAAMAVTAPTYVLEESLSSQRLWKHTAGNRPPQPVEERAFYEKMWAQNFARSQVNYEMPVEVLTATSPISLSPFADGGVMEISAAVAAEQNNGGNFEQYNMNTNTPANTHNMMMMPSTGGKGKEGGDGVGPNSGGGPEDHGGGPAIVGGGGLKEAPRPAPPTVLPPTNHQHIVNKTAKTESGDNLTVLVRGDNVFGTTVSKSFACSDEKGGPVTGVDTVNISIASYRVVESHKNGKYAQFLVIYREGSIRDTIGVWKRYSDFDDLAKKVTQAHEGCASVIANMSPLAITEEQDVEHLPNAITSWRLLKKRQRWFRCLDAGYLSLKVFLLERFLHDILFESSSPKLLREFVGANESLSR